MKYISVLAMTTATFATSAMAQDNVVLPTITLTANREATELSRSGSSVSVVNRQELLDRPGQPLADTISRLPGMTSRQSGPLGTTGSLQLRGAPSQYLPVLIDGIDVSDPAAGQPYFDIGGMTGSGINRIELLRGAQSALYGSRAVAGVLSLQSLRPTEDGLQQEFAIEAGSYRTLQASYGVTLRNADTDLAFQASRIITDGFSASDENDGNTEDDGYNATRLTFYAAHELQSGTTIGLNAFWEESRADFDDGYYDFVTGNYFFGDRYGTVGDDYTDKKSYGLRAFAEFSTGGIDHEIAATRYQLDRSSWSNGFESPFKGTRTKFSWQGATDIGTQGARAVFGADTEKEEAEGNGDARLSGVFAELNMPLGDRIDVSASLRRDDHSEFGGFTSGRLAAVYRADEDLLFRAAIGNGFRAPSLYELYSDYGNADLEREDSRTAEIGVEKRWGDFAHLRATAFWMEADNLIGWDADSFSCAAATGPFGIPGCYAQVDGTAKRSGVEIDGLYRLGDHALTAAYTYTDNGSSSEWSEVPQHVLNLGFETTFATRTTAAIQMRYVADRPYDLDDFTTVDVALRQPVRDDLEAYLRLENIFNEQYQLNDGYGTSDRAAYVGFRASF